MSRKLALIIGNTEYIDPGLAQLNAPGKDAEDFARVLQSKDVCGFDDVKISLNQPSSSVIETIDEFFDQKKPDDLLVLYFSGHGIKDEVGSLYLAFKNTVRSRLRSTAIKSDYIREAMDQSRSRRQILILDCCNSGAFPQGTKAEVGGVMGMAKAFQGYGRFVLTASDATQFAWEGDRVIGETDNSLFTHFLVKGLEGDADSDGDGRITVDEIYDYAYQQISKVTPKQTPTKSSSKQEGEIVLRDNMRIEDIKPRALSDDLINEIEDTRPYVREAAVQKLEKILNGKNIGLARSAREALEKIIEDENTTRRVAQAATQALESIRQIEQKAEAERRSQEERLACEQADIERKAREETEKIIQAKIEHEVIELEARRLKAENNAVRPKDKRKPAGLRRPIWKWAIFGIIGLSVITWGISSVVNPPATEVPPLPVEVTLWHAYGTGSSEETALSAIIAQAAVDMPQYKINVLQIPFNDIYTKYETDVAAGSGPDMFVAPNDNLGAEVRGGLVADITDIAAGRLGDYSDLSQGGMMYEGKLYGLPESLKAVAFWYNTDLLRTPPVTTDELKALMEGGAEVSITYGCYHHWGFFGSFGAQIFDSNYNFVTDKANQTNVTSAISYLNYLYHLSAENGWALNDTDGLAPFTEGKAAAIINGNWAMGDYRKALGDKLAVSPIPAGPGGASNPLLGVDGYYFNPNSANLEAALEVAMYLTNTAASTAMMNGAGHVPANTTVEVTDPLIQGLLDAFSTSYFRPQVENMGKYWANFCGTDQVFEAGTPAADWVKAAFDAATISK